MNYRHAFHAGNHTEVFKHAVLAALVCRLRQKEKPFAVIDTHAGIGLYDLDSAEARKTAEAQDGIAQVYAKSLPALEAYLGVVRSFNPSGLKTYPGSPSIVRALLRPGDRLVACELHAEDAARLKLTFKGDKRVAVHKRDGYAAMIAFVPPPERRGLVFADPPFESKDEFRTLAGSVTQAHRKWPTGMFAVWYPVKRQVPARRFLDEVRAAGAARMLTAEFLRYPVDDERLAGSGMLFINPPWDFDVTLRAICQELAAAFAGFAGTWTVDWLQQA